MYKDGIITISNWEKGMVRHPIYGFGNFKNVEVFENKGIAKIKNRTVLNTQITPTAVPIAEVYDIYGNTYTLTGVTGTGTCYKNGTSIQSGLANTWDLKIYKDYLWVRHSSELSCYGPLSSGGAQWFSSVLSGMSTTARGALLIGQDDFVYTGNGNLVSKLSITGTGTVGVAPTVSISASLDLPDGQYCSCLEEYGTKIVIGTHGGDNYFTRNAFPNARLYAWNRQPGTLGNPGLADLPVIFTSENGVNAIKQFANKLYVSVGTQGNIYVTDATNYSKIATLPYSLSGVDYSSSVYANAFDISKNGDLLVGASGSISDETKAGIYQIDLDSQGYPISMWMPSSTTAGTLNIGFINPKDYQLTKIGWSNNASYGVDDTDFRMYTSYGGVIETPLIKVGGYNTKKTFEHIEWCLAEPLVTGQNLRISYRKNNKESYTLINTWGFSTLGSVISFEDIAGISDCEYIQLKIELDQSLSALYGSNINLLTVKLW